LAELRLVDFRDDLIDTDNVSDVRDELQDTAESVTT
jgi:hypothetical protein